MEPAPVLLLGLVAAGAVHLALAWRPSKQAQPSGSEAPRPPLGPEAAPPSARASLLLGVGLLALYPLYATFAMQWLRLRVENGFGDAPVLVAAFTAFLFLFALESGRRICYAFPWWATLAPVGVYVALIVAGGGRLDFAISASSPQAAYLALLFAVAWGLHAALAAIGRSTVTTASPSNHGPSSTTGAPWLRPIGQNRALAIGLAVALLAPAALAVGTPPTGFLFAAPTKAEHSWEIHITPATDAVYSVSFPRLVGEGAAGQNADALLGILEDDGGSLMSVDGELVQVTSSGPLVLRAHRDFYGPESERAAFPDLALPAVLGGHSPGTVHVSIRLDFHGGAESCMRSVTYEAFLVDAPTELQVVAETNACV